MSGYKKGLFVVTEQLSGANDDVNKAEENLQRFRRSQNVIDPDSQARDLEQQLTAIVQDRRATRSQYEEAVARYNSLKQQLQSDPKTALVAARLTQSSRYQGLLNEIQKTELLLAQARLTLTERTPYGTKADRPTSKTEAIVAARAATNFRS